MLPELDSLTLFVGAALVLLITPGPAVLFVIARSLEQGRRAGVLSSLGLALGGLVHVAAAAAGVSAILATSAHAFQALKLAGAAYLIYLGLRTLLSRTPVEPTTEVTPRSLRRMFRDALLVQLLNPKPAIFFLAFLPQFVDPARGSSTVQIVSLGLLFVALALITDVAYALLAGTAREWLRASPRMFRAQRTCAGATYLGLGVATALVERPSM